MSFNSIKYVTLGSLIKKDLPKAYYLPSWPSTYTTEYRFTNDKKWPVFNYEDPPNDVYLNKIFPIQNLPTAGDEVPVMIDHEPSVCLKNHWKQWLPVFPAARLITVDEGLNDDVPIVTNGSHQCLPRKKHYIDPDLHYKLQLKSSIIEIDAPCPKYMDENELSFPCLLKVDMSASGFGNHLARNKEEFSEALRRIRDVCHWKEPVIYQEMIEGVKDVPNIVFYLDKSGEIHWIGTSSGGFNGFSFSSAMVDWDKQGEYYDLVHKQFTIPVTNYLHKHGFFGLVNFEVLCTDNGMYLVDLNPRFSEDTTHLLIAPYMARLGFKKSRLFLRNETCSTIEEVVEAANDVNKETKAGLVIILSAAEGEKRKTKYVLSIFAKTPDEINIVHDKFMNKVQQRVQPLQ